MRFLLLVPVVVVPVVALVVLLLAASRSSHDARMRLARRLEGRRGLLRLLGAAGGGAVAVVVVARDTLGLGLLLAGPVAALGLLVGVLAAELVVRPPAGPRRSASLTARRASDHVPPRLGAAVLTSGVTLLVLTAVTTALGSDDDLGRPGRWLTHACSATETASRGPWPGSYYTVPLLLLVGAGTLLAVLVLRTTVARPPLLPDAHDDTHGPDGPGSLGRPDVVDASAVAADHELRALAGRSVVAGLGVVLALPLAGTAAVAALAVGGMVGCAPAWWGAVAAGLLVVAALALAVLLWCLAVLLVGSHRPATRPTGAVR